MNELEKTYQPNKVEEKIYKMWEDGGYFKPEINPDGKPFCIIMPPPNANGSLHLGHAVFVTLEDIMTRYARMNGMAALWLPGADHAGFETQVVFEKKLEKEGKSRFQIERDELYKMMRDFTQENKKRMEDQLKKLGASCNWDREKFTLDEDIKKVVYRTFKKLYDDGLVYRALRSVNWCTKHQTTLSDLEVKYIEKIDPLYYIKYGPIENPKSEIQISNKILNSNDKKGEYLTVATVRPETMFGDTAIAVNPNDERYAKYIGLEVVLPLTNRTIPVISDEYVDPKFGTGVVKITPAHDPNDFEIAQKHHLEIKEVIDQFGKMNEKAGPYAGMKIEEARAKVVEDMKKKGLIEKIDENYKHTVGTCYKCGRTIEPRALEQWFVAMTKTGKSGKALAPDALKIIDENKIKFYPENYKKIIKYWLKNIRDWNISRQIVWGIRIPAWYCGGVEKVQKGIMGFNERVVPQLFEGKTKTYRLRDHVLQIGDILGFENSQTKTLVGYGKILKIEKMPINKINLKDKDHGATYDKLEDLIAAFKRLHPHQEVTPHTMAWIYSYEFIPIKEKDCGQIIISGEKPAQCPACNGKSFVQDNDVFDTWFSSGQWPFATLETQSNKGDLEKYYPTQIMETGRDILFFWVARMIMLGLYEKGEIPFSEVYLHGLVRDKDRVKMSKSKGNVIDPLGVAEDYGTDAVRLALVFGTGAANDTVISEEKIRGMRNFANKLWNISRFVLINQSGISNFQFPISKLKDKTDKDEWILAELDKTVKKMTKYYQKYQFSMAGEEIYNFIWKKFADIYIEASKEQSKDEQLKENTQEILLYTLKTSLKLLHPIMPYVTEEIWGKLPGNKNPLIIEKWPK